MTQTIDIARAYYTAMGEKNIDAMTPYLHEDVVFIAPLAQTKGKEALVTATRNFIQFFESLTIRSVLGSKDQATVVYDVNIPIVGKCRDVALLTFQDDHISGVELFYDARPFETIRNTIFQKN